MANPVRLPSVRPAAGTSAHVVAVEPVTPQLRQSARLTGEPVWAAVERYQGRMVKVCAAGDDLATVTARARAAAGTYGATFTAPHPATLATTGTPGALGEGAGCVYDPQLHTGPAHAETPAQRAARVQVAREVCEDCPVRALCLPYALAAAPDTGVWAGRTTAEITALSGALVELGQVA
ncbi:WhiB family transcriptional regulator [Sphaerisporangium sp. NPDC051011]|uniref:WhiB family transcriptional regulator n=1 Tax=Sphaerisporangium sp. NPDC051011 TaxID=3155792 RepID=UPI0033EB35FD